MRKDGTKSAFDRSKQQSTTLSASITPDKQKTTRMIRPIDIVSKMSDPPEEEQAVDIAVNNTIQTYNDNRDVRVKLEQTPTTTTNNNNNNNNDKDNNSQQWLCDVCKMQRFDTFEEACEHEKYCPGPPSSNNSTASSSNANNPMPQQQNQQNNINICTPVNNDNNIIASTTVHPQQQPMLYPQQQHVSHMNQTTTELYPQQPHFIQSLEQPNLYQCRHCLHILPQYRAPQSMYLVDGSNSNNNNINSHQGQQGVPMDFVEQHLSMCNGLQSFGPMPQANTNYYTARPAHHHHQGGPTLTPQLAAYTHNHHASNNNVNVYPPAAAHSAYPTQNMYTTTTGPMTVPPMQQQPYYMNNNPQMMPMQMSMLHHHQQQQQQPSVSVGSNQQENGEQQQLPPQSSAMTRMNTSFNSNLLTNTTNSNVNMNSNGNNPLSSNIGSPISAVNQNIPAPIQLQPLPMQTPAVTMTVNNTNNGSTALPNSNATPNSMQMGGNNNNNDSKEGEEESTTITSNTNLAQIGVTAGDVSLTTPDDRYLLTDYFLYLIQQLQVCYFAESDRKTRGGKRENIAVGYAGLQCRHCAGHSFARKFFWSDAGRLANSFSEIPGHVMMCRMVSQEVKKDLAKLKKGHPEQMARLPRGSQKVFIRRMWRRIHGQTEMQLEEISGNRNGKEKKRARKRTKKNTSSTTKRKKPVPAKKAENNGSPPPQELQLSQQNHNPSEAAADQQGGDGGANVDVNAAMGMPNQQYQMIPQHFVGGPSYNTDIPMQQQQQGHGMASLPPPMMTSSSDVDVGAGIVDSQMQQQNQHPGTHHHHLVDTSAADAPPTPSQTYAL